MKVVLDTNVLVAALLNPRGIPADILNLVLNEEVTLCYDDRIIGEYRSVLKRDKFGLDSDDVDTVIDFLEEAGIRGIHETVFQIALLRLTPQAG